MAAVAQKGRGFEQLAFVGVGCLAELVLLGLEVEVSAFALEQQVLNEVARHGECLLLILCLRGNVQGRAAALRRPIRTVDMSCPESLT